MDVKNMAKSKTMALLKKMRTFLCVRAVKCKITKTVAEMNFSTYWHCSIENPGNFFNTDMDGDRRGMGGYIHPMELDGGILYTVYPHEINPVRFGDHVKKLG